MAACLLEKEPSMNVEELKEVIIQSGNLMSPNNYLGYGVPDCERALEIITNPEGIFFGPLVDGFRKTRIIELDKPSIYITVYHKNGWKVLKKETIRTDRTKIKIKRREDVTSSTVIWEEGSLEIVWEY